MNAHSDYETVLFHHLPNGVATVTLNRPDVLNAFNGTMVDEFARLWARIRDDDRIRAVVLRANGDRAFSTGLDTSEGLPPRNQPSNVWLQQDPGTKLGPKQNGVWKPVIGAVHGMAAGGAFYWLNEVDIIVCSDDATFFDPHVSYGLTAACEPIGLLGRMPYGEVVRMAIMGLDERISARRAFELGFVSEIVQRAELWSHANDLATTIAAKPPAAVQGTIRAIWESLGLPRSEALSRALMYTQIGNPVGLSQVDVKSARPSDWRTR